MSATMLARCVHGIEWVCADEIAGHLPVASDRAASDRAATDLAATDLADLALSRRELTFTVAAPAPWLTGLRTVDDVFLRIGEVDGVGTTKDTPPALARRVARLPFAAGLAQLRTLRTIDDRPRYDIVASLEGRRGFNRFAVETAVGAALAPVLHGSYLERTSAGRPDAEPDLTVRIFVRGSAALVALRLGARPLHRRPYKQDTGPATMHPPIAAALARLAGSGNAEGPSVLLDPFCGDGTVAIEAALSYPDSFVVAGDIDPARLANARHNGRRAGVDVPLVRADVAEPPWRRGSVDAVATNPPWGRSISPRGRLACDIDPLWRRLPVVLADLLAERGRLCLVTDADLDAPETLRRAGYLVTLRSRIRLAGRIAHLVVGAPPGRPAPTLPEGLAAWRRRAIAEGVVTDAGF